MEQVVGIGPRKGRAQQVALGRGVQHHALAAVAEAGLDDEGRPEPGAVAVEQFEIRDQFARDDHRGRHLEAGGHQARMEQRFIERRQRDVERVDHPRAAFGRDAHQPVEDILRLVMFAVHVQQHARPDFAQLVEDAERLDPERFDEEKIQPALGAMLLDAMDEKIIRIQLVGHHQVIGPGHVRTIWQRRRTVNAGHVARVVFKTGMFGS